MAGKRLIEIILRAKDEASKNLKGFDKTVGGLGKSLGSLGILGPLSLAAVGAGAAKLAWDAMELEPTRITFDNLSESIGSTADIMLEELRPATMGMVSDADLMASANKLVSMGLAKTDKEAAKLAKMATKLGMAMGKGPTQAMEEFALMLANQSIPRLDTFGISAGTVRERIAELMEETEGMTREQAFMNAVMEQGEISMERVGDISGTTAVKMARVRTAVENLKTGIGEALIPVLDAGAQAFLYLEEVMSRQIGTMSEASGAVYDMVSSEEAFIDAMYDTLPPLIEQEILLSESKKAVFDLAYAQEYQSKAVDELLTMLEPWEESMETIVPLTEDAASATAAWAGALNEVEKVIKEHNKYKTALEEAIEYAKELGLEEAERTIKTQLFREEIKEVGTDAKKAFIDELLTYIEQTHEPLDGVIGRAELVQQGILEIGPAFDRPMSQVEEFSNYWGGLTDKTIRIDVDFYYEHFGVPGPGFEPPPAYGPFPRYDPERWKEEMQMEILDLLIPGRA